MTDDIARLPPDKIKAAIERLEQDKPAIPEVLTTEREFVDPAVNAIIAERDDPPPPPREEPRPRKSRKATPATEPKWFYIQTGKPMNGSAGEIREGWYVVHDGQVFLCNAGSVVEPEGRKVEERGALYTARAMLRAKLSARQPGPDHRQLVYQKIYY